MDIKNKLTMADKIGKSMLETGIGKVVSVFTRQATCPAPLVELGMRAMGVTKSFADNEQETFHMNSFDGCDLLVNIIKARPDQKKDNKKRAVITAHGFKSCHQANWRYAKLFLDKGFDVVLLDQRHQGASEHGKYKCTMGVNEAKDLGELAKLLRKRYGDDLILGLHGESCGSAAILLYAPEDPNLAFAIEDCSFSSFELLFKDLLCRFTPFLNADHAYKVAKRAATVGKVNYDMAVPIDAVRRISPDVPVMFIHGAWDMYIPHQMSIDMYNVKQGKKKLRITPFANHAMSIDTNKKNYFQQVYDFFDEFDVDC